MSIPSAQLFTDPDPGEEALVPPQDTVSWVLRIPDPEVVFVTAVLEGYEGLCLTTSLDRDSSTLIIQVPSGQVELAKEVLDNIDLAVGRIEQFTETEARRILHGTSAVSSASNSVGDTPASPIADN
jgi:uncharacterized protein DUF4911